MPKKFDKSWTLFLDRDGVINEHLPNDYVKRWSDFRFLPGSLEALRILSERFGRLIVVTNQHGVAKNIMSHEDLEEIHRRMLDAIRAGGGSIDRIYAATTLEGSLGDIRKPHPRMAHQAATDFPDIELSRSVIVGDSESDMLFGKNAGMKTVFIGDISASSVHRDAIFGSLLEFARSL